MVREVLIPLNITLIVVLGVVLVVEQQQKIHLVLTIMLVLVEQTVEMGEVLKTHIQTEVEAGLNKEELVREAQHVSLVRLVRICMLVVAVAVY